MSWCVCVCVCVFVCVCVCVCVQWVVLSAAKDSIPRSVLDYFLKQQSIKEIFK